MKALLQQACVCGQVETSLSPFWEVYCTRHLGWEPLSEQEQFCPHESGRRDRLCTWGRVNRVGDRCPMTNWGQSVGTGPKRGPPCLCPILHRVLRTRGEPIFFHPWPARLHLSPVLPPHFPASPLPTSLSAHFPREQTRRQTQQPGKSLRWQQQGEQGTCVHLPGFPDPDLNPRSASCQPGCSQADIAAGAFSAAFPQICLLQGLLKRSPRFLCYSRLHSLPSSKAQAPRGVPGEGAAGGGQCPA